MAQANTPATPETNTPAPAATKRPQWAAERARLESTGDLVGTRAKAGRFARLADCLIAAEVANETSLSFAECNTRMGADRLVGPAGVASWRTLVQRAKQVGVATDWRVDPETAALVYVAPKP